MFLYWVWECFYSYICIKAMMCIGTAKKGGIFLHLSCVAVVRAYRLRILPDVWRGLGLTAGF